MSRSSLIGADFDAHKLQQTIKWTVYGLLLVNFGFYIYEDATRAAFTITAESNALAWTRAFATSIDESAWFILLFMFELETYIIEDENWTKKTSATIRAVRVICFAMIAHTVYAFGQTVVDYQPTVLVENASSLCDLADDQLSFVYNLSYTEITPETCSTLSSDTAFYRVGSDPVVSDMRGLSLERNLALADLAEVLAWLIVILAIEIIIRLQSRGVTEGPIVSAAKYSKWAMYVFLLGLGVYWASLSHWVYLWDEMLWVGGFAAIEMNISEWREEMAASST